MTPSDRPAEAVDIAGRLTGAWLDAQVNLTDPATRAARLDDFLVLLRAVALPWFGGSARPEAVAAKLPALTIDLFLTDLAEWLVCQGHRGGAARLVERWLTEDPARRPDFEAGRPLAARPEPSAGWSSATLGLA